MPNFERRLTALERRLHVHGPLEIIIEGALPGEPTFATFSERRWERQAGEAVDVFAARVTASATQARLPFVIIGGVGPLDRVDPLTFETTTPDID